MNINRVLELEELSGEVCQLFESEKFNLEDVYPLLRDLSKKLQKATRRFVDIDSSVRDDELQMQNVRDNILAAVQDQQTQECLLIIYVTLKNYLGLTFKYGEAAEWFLTNEFDSYLAEKINEALVRSSV